MRDAVHGEGVEPDFFFMIESLEARLARRVIIRSRSNAGLLA